MSLKSFRFLSRSRAIRNSWAVCLFSWIVFAVCAPLLPAQAKPALKADGKTVPLAVTVRDKHGNLVTNLTAADFTLADNSQPQTIQSFTQSANQPLTLGLLIDTSSNQHNMLDDERSASSKFLDQVFTGPQDKAFLIQFAHQVDLLADVTSSKDKLQHGFDLLGTFLPGSQNSGDSPDQTSGGKRNVAATTTLYDAIFLASDELMKKQPGRRVLVVLTDGIDHSSKESMNDAIEAALKADTVVYAIYVKGEEPRNNPNSKSNPNSSPGSGRRGGMGWPGGGNWPGGGGNGNGWPGGNSGGNNGGNNRRGVPPPAEAHGDGKKVLQQICSQTGGSMFEAKKDRTGEVYSKISEELHSQYIVSYTPGKGDRDAGYHHINLTPKQKNLSVQTRDGYYVVE